MKMFDCSFRLFFDFQKIIEYIIFENIFKNLEWKLGVVFYDVTTLYFEGAVPDKLRDYGFSKEAKFGVL